MAEFIEEDSCLDNVIKLTAADIPGADLNEPLESYTVPALKWWLLCRGIKVSSSIRKQQLINRIRGAIKDNVDVVDVDGSYLYKKRKALEESGQLVAPLDVPLAPITGWETITENNFKDMAKKLPSITSGTLYTYLSSHVSQRSSEGTFRALTRGYIHWASGRINQIEVNTQNPDYCHVQSLMTPSMKPGTYHVWLLIRRDGQFASIQNATCQCAAGKSASCTHVSALLHLLVALTGSQFQLQPFVAPEDTPAHEDDDDDDDVPVTSRLCQWKSPKRKKESSMSFAEATFEKHVYGREKKRKWIPLEDFDPRPQEFRGTVCDRLPSLLMKIRSENLCISVLLDEHFRHWDNPISASDPILPDVESLRQTVEAFKSSLALSDEEIRRIESNTRQQSNSPLWFDARRYRITASKFGSILRRRSSTPPDSLVLSVLQPKQIKSAAIEWGVFHESIAVDQYIAHQRSCGHTDLTVAPCGFYISKSYPYLGATPDGAVYDPSSLNEPFGFLEVKCPYTHRNGTPEQASTTAGFCCSMDISTGKLTLRTNHMYYAQVQGQMAIGCRQWCDFVVFTTKGISIQRISFDSDYWENNLLPKLVEFYDNCLGPEIVSPVHVLGIPIRHLK